MKIQVLWVAILGMMTTMVAQQNVIPVVRVKAASKRQKPATRSAVIARAMCDEAGDVYSRETNDGLEAPIQETTPDAQLASRLRWKQTFPTTYYCPYMTTTYGTPLVIACHGLQFEDAFTDPEHGVRFSFAADEGGRKPWVAWTKAGVDVEFLVLPDAKTGEVTSFKFNMFGNLTPQIPNVGEN